MNEFLLSLLGGRAENATRVVSADFQVHPAVGLLFLFVLVVLTVGVAAWSYARSDVELTRGRRRVLFALRFGVLLALAVILLRPELGLGVEGLIRQELVLLLDDSASMRLRDPRTDAPDRVRLAIAQGRVPAQGGIQQNDPGGETLVARMDVLKAVLTNRELALVERLGREFDLKPLAFSSGLTALGSGDTSLTNRAAVGTGVSGEDITMAIRGEGRETAPGTAIREVLERERARPLGGIILLSDGIRNAGADLSDASELAREAGVPVHAVGLGTTQPRDLQVAELTVPEVAFVRDEVQVSARVRARGVSNEAVQVKLVLDRTVVDERDVVPAGEGEVSVGLKFTPEQTGDFELAVEVPVRADEILAENNRLTRRVRVVDDRIRVLLAEQSPRWEFRYLQALLLRDRRVDLKCVLFDGDPAIARGQGSPYLDSFPTRREDLFAYDLVVFGDVDPRNFTPSQIELLAEFVSRGGGSFLMMAGRRFSPWGYRDTPLEQLLPVEFDHNLIEAPGSSVYERPLKLALTPEGRVSPLLRLAEAPEENLRRWNTLPPIFWVAPVRAAKPAAQVLVVKNDENAEDGEGGQGGRIPVIAMQQYGVGRAMYIGTDNTWRWRRNEGESFHVAFWGRVVQRLAIHHLLSGSRRTQLSLDRGSVTPGERVGVSARLFNTAFEPLSDPSVTAVVEADAGSNTNRFQPAELLLRAVPDQPGFYHGELVAPAPGRYRIRVGTDAPAVVDFTVEDRLAEAGETAMQETVLRELASSTGGGFFREEDLHRLPDAVRSKAQHVVSRLTIDLWSSPIYYLIVLVFLTAEWGLRKWWHLK